MACRHLLLVDADVRFRDLLSRELASTGEFAAAAAANGATAMEWLGRTPFDAVLLDLDLPDIGGILLCRHIRQQCVSAPIVMLARGATDDMVIAGLDAGAIDVIAKPASPAVVRARLRAHLRPYERSADALLRVGRFQFRPSAKRLHDPGSGRAIALTGTEAGLLRYLHCAGRRTVPRQELMDKVLGYCAEVTSHTVETHIYRLRRKLETDPRRPELLLTDGGGYCLAASA